MRVTKAKEKQFSAGFSHVAGFLAVILIAGQGCVAPMKSSAPVQQEGSLEGPPPPIMPPKASPELVVNSGGPLAPPGMLPPQVAEPGVGKTYTIKRGDSLSKIAKSHGLSTKQLAEMNQISNPNKIVIGQKLIIPGSMAAVSSGGGSSPARKSQASGGGYTVQSGDVLSRIAVRNGTTVDALVQANNLKNKNAIVVGQKLVIPSRSGMAYVPPPKRGTPAPLPPAPRVTPKPAPAPVKAAAPTPAPVAPKTVIAPPPPPPEPEPMLPPAPQAAAPLSEEPDFGGEEPMEYTVLTGDTLDEVAKLFIVSKEQIMKLNNLETEDSLQPGQTILIPPPEL